MAAPTHENPSSVSSIELFFDLVFVFVITQVTQLVEHAHGAMDFLRALLVLIPIWWRDRRISPAAKSEGPASPFR